MKVAAIFAYVLFQIIYLIFTDGSRPWCGFNLVTQMCFIAYMCNLMEGSKRIDQTERLLFKYLKYVLCAESVYTIVCVFKNTYWAIYQTDIFAYLWGISFVVMLVYFAYNRDNLK